LSSHFIVFLLLFFETHYQNSLYMSLGFNTKGERILDMIVLKKYVLADFFEFYF